MSLPGSGECSRSFDADVLLARWTHDPAAVGRDESLIAAQSLRRFSMIGSAVGFRLMPKSKLVKRQSARPGFFFPQLAIDPIKNAVANEFDLARLETRITRK